MCGWLNITREMREPLNQLATRSLVSVSFWTVHLPLGITMKANHNRNFHINCGGIVAQAILYMAKEKYAFDYNEF